MRVGVANPEVSRRDGNVERAEREEMKSMILLTGSTNNIDWNTASQPLHTGLRASTDSSEQRIDMAAQQIALNLAA